MTVFRRALLAGIVLLAQHGQSIAQDLEKTCLVESENVCEEQNSTENNDSHDKQDDPFLDCGLYMAPSSIPNAGWSMYTGKSIQQYESIQPVELAIQMEDFFKHVKARQALHNETLPDWLLNSYYWKPDETDGHFDGADMTFISGFGAMVNYHPAFVNIAPSGITRKQQVSRSSPQAGAFTEYKGMKFYATQDIPAGHELSMSYGSSYFDGTPIPTASNFKRADRMVKLVHKTCLGQLDTDVCRELWQMVRHGKDVEESVCQNFLVNEASCKNLWKQMVKSKTSTNRNNAKIIAALPQTLDGVQEALVQGCAWHMAPNVQPSIEWLQKNGICLDHIEPRAIEHAGSGAFAKRALSKGSLVAPAPVAHLHRGHLDLFIVDENDPSQIHWHGHQLMWNYVYSHPSTSLVFLPYSPVVNYINHSPTDANVELRWSSRMSHPEWMNKSTAEIVATTEKAGLMMEIVALRDIQEGDEILLDYGNDWQEAWERHIENWQAPISTDFLRSLKSHRNQMRLPTLNDTDSNDIEPIDSSLTPVCWVDDYQLKKIDKHEYAWNNSTTAKSTNWVRYLCTLVSRHDVNGTTTYDADMTLWRKQVTRVTGIHRRAIDFVSRPYTSNQYLRQSFRHEIHLPDHMISDAWKDRAIVEESMEGAALTEMLNDYTVPVRTVEEQALDPYPASILIGCHHIPLNEYSEHESKWEYSSSIYESAGNVSRCDVLERHGDDSALAYSIHPARQNYTVRVWNVNGGDGLLTGVPRRAIEFFAEEIASDLSFANGIQLDVDNKNRDTDSSES